MRKTFSENPVQDCDNPPKAIFTPTLPSNGNAVSSKFSHVLHQTSIYTIANYPVKTKHRCILYRLPRTTPRHLLHHCQPDKTAILVIKGNNKGATGPSRAINLRRALELNRQSCEKCKVKTAFWWTFLSLRPRIESRYSMKSLIRCSRLHAW